MNIANLSTPIAIVIAGAIIAGAVFLASGKSSNGDAATALQEPPSPASGNLEDVRPIDGNDHIRGNSSAPVKIVEYSDFECPFCKSIHPTLQRIVEEYDGQVAWVYRHFPLDQLHPVKSRKESSASECAAKLGGNDAFWKFADRFFELTPSNNQTDIDTVLPQIAKELGLDAAAFNSCLTSGTYDERVEDDYQNAIATGGQGTPWSIVIAENGKKYPLSGAQPYENVKALVETALKAK